MSDDQKEKMRDQVMEAARNAPDKEEMTEAMPEEPASGPVKLATGQFKDTDSIHKVREMRRFPGSPTDNTFCAWRTSR